MYVLVVISSLLSSLVTFYSGFGLGTILMAVLAIFFPLPQAIIITAIVHLINSGLKSSLLYKSIHWNIALKFGAIALIAAIPGALLFKKLSFLPAIQDYSIFGLFLFRSWLLDLSKWDQLTSIELSVNSQEKTWKNQLQEIRNDKKASFRKVSTILSKKRSQNWQKKKFRNF